MAGLSEVKRRALAAMVGQAPDAVLQAIEARFQYAGGETAADVVAEVREVMRRRTALNQIFWPVVAFFADRPDGAPGPRYPRPVIDKLFALVAERRPDLVHEVMAAGDIEADLQPSAELLDALCAEAAAILRGEPLERLGLINEAAAEDLAAMLDVSPVARSVLDRLPEWLTRMDDQQAAALRLSFRDAGDVRDDGRVRLMEMLIGRLPNAAMGLRLIAVLTDHRSAAFVEASEMSIFAARLLTHLESLASRLRIDGPRTTVEDLDTAGAVLTMAVDILVEFDFAFPAASSDVWSRRLGAVRKRMAEQLEAVLRRAKAVVDRALPLENRRLVGRMSRMSPDLSADPASPAACEARALLGLLASSRSAAAALGCEAVRRQTAETLADQIDQYAEEVLQMIHVAEADLDGTQARALLELAADLLGLARSEEAGALVRRRTVVAFASEDTATEAAA